MNQLTLENLPNLQKLPSNYRPFEELMFCSNLFQGVRVPIAVGNQPILLVGKGDVPLLWLAARSAPESSTWMYVVDASRVANSALDVEFGNPITVMIQSTKIVTVIKETDTKAKVVQLDLRPLGVNVTGNESGLQIGSNNYSHNVIAGAEVGIKLVPSPAVNAPQPAAAG